LGEAVEGERGHGAFEMRCRDAQGCSGSNTSRWNRDLRPRSSVYSYIYLLRAFMIRARARRMEHIDRSSAERWTPARRRVVSYGIAAKPS